MKNSYFVEMLQKKQLYQILKIVSGFWEKIWKTRWRWLLVALFIGLLLFLITPTPRFDYPTSTVVLSSENDLLGARIASDGQWRFPETDSIPKNYEKALLAFEDQWFYYHLGVNPIAIFRAIRLNLKYQEVVSGGSTITMQVARLSRKNPPRNFTGKLLEMAMAVKLELLKSKKEILRIYASSAPYGGNVVGIDAAAWRYYKRPANQLSWAEAATLAILPNAPALIYPGRNSQELKRKRDQLLKKLLYTGEIDSMTFQLSLAEELPSKPNPLPNSANHLVDEMAQTHYGKMVKTTIKNSWQDNANAIAKRHSTILAENDIHNLAILIVEVETGNILAYVGNSPGIDEKYGSHVNIVNSPRSTGSILKPFLYASMIQYGELLPYSLVKDIPINFAGYSPKNFDYEYAGAVPAAQALSQSLNVPAVEMLYQFGEARFLDILKGVGLTTFNKPADHYGLTLILGGGEANLYELAGAYASMARILNRYNKTEEYNLSDIYSPKIISTERTSDKSDQHLFKASSIYATFNALQQVNRPEGRTGWWNFSSTNKVAWKTGTSFGFRDAWAIATTPQYVVAVWCGNANGEGRAGLTGSKAAAPVLFDLMDFMPQSGWFEKPINELATVEICSQSGYLASSICPHKKSVEVPESGLKTPVCPFHHIVHLSADRLWQVNSSCYPLGQMVHDSVFVLPPAMEWYYRKNHPNYSTLPPYLQDCQNDENIQSIELISPRNLTKLYVPLEMNGSRGEIVFEAAHRNMNKRLFWHLDGTFIGETDHFHQMGISPSVGTHTLSLIDVDGNTLTKRFTIVGDK